MSGLTHPERVGRISTRAALLGCPSRVEILLALLDSAAPPRQVDIVSRSRLKQATVAYHLRLLRDGDLVTCRRQEGVSRYHLTQRGRAAVSVLDDASTERPHIGAST